MTLDAKLQDRVMKHVQMDPNGGCWLWGGNFSRPHGYGLIYFGRLARRAHRVSYTAFCGPVGDQFVLHKCDVRACVNPDHLYLGDHADNMADLVSRGRASRKGGAKGAARSTSKLTDEKVLEIRASSETSPKLAARFLVTSSLIRRIRRRGAWKHV